VIRLFPCLQTCIIGGLAILYFIFFVFHLLVPVNVFSKTGIVRLQYRSGPRYLLRTPITFAVDLFVFSSSEWSEIETYTRPLSSRYPVVNTIVLYHWILLFAVQLLCIQMRFKIRVDWLQSLCVSKLNFTINILFSAFHVLSSLCNSGRRVVNIFLVSQATRSTY
jgi:hypothetical protein